MHLGLMDINLESLSSVIARHSLLKYDSVKYCDANVNKDSLPPGSKFRTELKRLYAAAMHEILE
jgi:hypothetical protein